MLRDLGARDVRDGVRAAAERAHRLPVDDVAAARAELEAKGVEFAGETLDSGVCHMAFFRDPDGNDLMLHHRYAPRAKGGRTRDHRRAERLRLGPVTDLERSTRFYAETLGLEQIGARRLARVLARREREPLPARPDEHRRRRSQGRTRRRSRSASPDVEEARQALEAKGVEFAGETFDTGVCHMAHFHDPDGNTLMLHRRYAPHEG